MVDYTFLVQLVHSLGNLEGVVLEEVGGEGVADMAAEVALLAVLQYEVVAVFVLEVFL